jgi:hypothetical protein
MFPKGSAKLFVAVDLSHHKYDLSENGSKAKGPYFCWLRVVHAILPFFTYLSEVYLDWSHQSGSSHICFRVTTPFLLADCITRLLARYEHQFSHYVFCSTEFKMNLCCRNRFKYYIFLA